MPVSATLSDTSRCPVGDICGSCATRDGLAVIILDTVMGCHCETVCRACAECDTARVTYSLPELASRVVLHCGHLGLTLDDMAQLMALDDLIPRQTELP